jgi:hypothetical protein
VLNAIPNTGGSVSASNLAASGTGSSSNFLRGDMAWSTLSRSNMPAGSVLQVVNVQSGAVATGTTIIPGDDTIPQITEGTEYITLAITPTSATSKLLIQIVWMGATTVPSCTIALFQDATANALAATISSMSASSLTTIPLNYFMTAGTTSSTTFRLRFGSGNAATTTTNGQGGSRFYGGVANTSITITEIAA